MTEARGRKNRQYVIRGVVEELIEQLVVEGDQDGEDSCGGDGDGGCYIDDFLLTHRTFVESRRVSLLDNLYFKKLKKIYYRFFVN